MTAVLDAEPRRLTPQTLPADPGVLDGTGGRARAQAYLVALVTAAVLVADQLTKAWGWRHHWYAHIDSGGGVLLGNDVGSWFRSPLPGALVDVGSAGVLLAATWLLLRRVRRPGVIVPASLVLAGCASNLADRLGMHHLTAPGSRRGVVDFFYVGSDMWNLADAAIAVGTVGLAIVGVAGLVRRLSAPARPRSRRRPQSLPVVPAGRPRRRLGLVVASTMAVVTLLALAGAVSSGGMQDAFMYYWTAAGR